MGGAVAVGSGGEGVGECAFLSGAFAAPTAAAGGPGCVSIPHWFGDGWRWWRLWHCRLRLGGDERSGKVNPWRWRGGFHHPQRWAISRRWWLC
jgi:hypothetical protein